MIINKPRKGLSMARRRAKRDIVEPEIVSALEQAGFSVFRLHEPCDLLVGFRGKNHLVEVKTGNKGYGKKLNPNQQAFNDTWRGALMVKIASAQEVIDWAVDVASR